MSESYLVKYLGEEKYKEYQTIWYKLHHEIFGPFKERVANGEFKTDNIWDHNSDYDKALSEAIEQFDYRVSQLNERMLGFLIFPATPAQSFPFNPLDN